MSQFNVTITVTETNEEGSFVHASVSLAAPGTDGKESAADKKKSRDSLSDLIGRAAAAADASVGK